MRCLNSIFLSGVLLLLLSGCAGLPEPTPVPEPVMPTKLDLPIDYVATKADYLDDLRIATGWFLGRTKFRGNGIKKRNGIYPIYVRKASPGEFPGDPIKKGDVIIGVNGRPLVKKRPVEQFVKQFKKAYHKHEVGKLSVTLWRRGEIRTVTLEVPPVIPDVTKGHKPTDIGDWQLGPTGINGWVYSRNPRSGASRDARQIVVTLIEKGSAADGKVRVGDVIIGIAGKKFDRDARRAFAAAIVEAEKKANGGKLDLMVWRPPSHGLPPSPKATAGQAGATGSGKTSSVVLTIGVLPDPSQTSPYDCPKTDKIIDNAVAYLLKNEAVLLKAKQKGWLSYINGLGLLATGRDDVMPAVKKLAHGTFLKKGETIDLEKPIGMDCWWWSYKTIYLCEYYLRTKDKAVLPTIEEYATKIAMGQSGVGTWGHGYAEPHSNNGKLHGRLKGYGAINQQGVSLMIALPLAVKCGIKNKEIADAIRRGDTFFSFYTGKGTVPYGDHKAVRQWFDSNGKSGSTAIMFDLLDDPKGRRFFSTMVVASAATGREIGHTGCFWSHLWGGIGAARSGKQGMIGFMQEMDYAFTLERHASGRLAFQGNAGEKNGFGTKGSRGVLKKEWDSTGARLLQLCVPRKAIYLTGKGTVIDDPLDGKRVDQFIKDGALINDSDARAKLSKDEIRRLLGSELPALRSVAERAISEQGLRMEDELVAMIDSRNRFSRYGACHALKDSGYGSKKAVDRLIKVIKESDDLYLRLCALEGLTGGDPKRGLAHAAKHAIPALLELTVQRFDIDPRRLLQRKLSFTLFDRNGLVSLHGIDDIDPGLLNPAIKELLTVDDGRARSLVGNCLKKMSTERLQPLWQDVIRAIKNPSPSGIMFNAGIRETGLTLLVNGKYREGIALCVEYVTSMKAHGSQKRIYKVMKWLQSYGTEAKSALPELYKARKYYLENLGPGKKINFPKWATDEFMKGLNEGIKAIEGAKEAPGDLKTLKDR